MKAILWTTYGPPEALELKELEKPVIHDDQVLVKVHAASINALDWQRYKASAILVRLLGGGLREPKKTSIGVDLAGRVEAVGNGVTQFRPGDAVFGVAKSAFAEYARAAEDKLALKPENVSFEAAAAVPVAGFTALQGLRDKAKVQPGQKVLIYGASGGVGGFAVQIAKAFGAEVTAVCSTRNVDIARSIGADHVIDYKREDFTKNRQRYDLILAVNGYRSILDCRRVLAPNGIHLLAGGELRQFFEGILLGQLLSMFGTKKFQFMGIARTDQKDLMVLRDFLETGTIVPVIDRCYPLSQAPVAFRYILDEHARGKVVITVE